MISADRGSWRAIVVILVVTFALRLTYVLFYPQLPVINDALAYDQEARDLTAGNGIFPQSDGSGRLAKGPVYPLFLAAIYFPVTHDHRAARVTQAALGTLAVLLLFLLAQRIFGVQVAVLAASMAAIYPAFISYSGLLLTESLSVVLVLAFVYAMLGALGRLGIGPWIAAGAAGGILILVREEMMIALALTALAVWWWRGQFRQVAVLLLAAALTVFPWTLRNYLVHDQFVLVSAQGGSTLWISSFPKERLAWDPEDPYYQGLVAGLSGLEADRRLRQEGIRNIVEQPLAYLRACVERIPVLWIGGHSNTIAGLDGSLGSYVRQEAWGKVAVKLLMLAYNIAIIVLGFIGIWWAWRTPSGERVGVALLALPVFVKAVVHFFLFATLRYQVPIMALLIIFAAFTIVRSRSGPDAVVAAGA